MGGTDFKRAPLSEYSYHKQALAVGLYNYYSYVHPGSGQVIIMREEIATENVDYADGGHNHSKAWTDKAILDYKELSKI